MVFMKFISNSAYDRLLQAMRFRGILRKTGPAGFVIYNMKPELQDPVINRPAGPTDETKVPH